MGSPWHTGTREESLPVSNSLVFPNPASSQVTFMLPQEQQASQLRIMDITGKLITELPASGETVLDVSAWKSGVYFYSLPGAAQTVRGKFVVE
jgi:hypothetical protein